MVKDQAMPAQTLVQGALSGMTEGRMPDIVHQRQRFDKILVQAQGNCGGARNLCHLDRMGQTAAKMIRRSAGKHLRLSSQPAKRP
jgi:hypothetical protein